MHLREPGALNSRPALPEYSPGTLPGEYAVGLHQPHVCYKQAAAAPVALAQLPPLVTGFTGREAELAQVTGLLDPAAGAGTVVVSAVEELAGVGKTALAIHAGHAARSRSPSQVPI